MKRSFWLQFVSSIVLFTLLVSCTGTSTPTPPTAKFIDDNIFAKVGQRGAAQGETMPFVVIFEERHDSRVGQVEIAIMLNRLYSKNGVRHLALEGAMIEQTPPSASWFQSLPNADVRRDVALQLLEQGEISAAEFIAMVYSDFQLHPVEKESEHAVTMSDAAGIAPVGYLYMIASTSLSQEQISKANSLEGMEAVEYIINSNAWTKKRYELFGRTNPSPQIEEMIKLVDELEPKAKEVHADVGEYAAGLRELRNFYTARGNASTTMTGYATDIAKKYSEAPIAMVIGAAHTSATTNLFQDKSISFAVLSPLALVSDEKTASIYTTAYDRKVKRISVDPAGMLGAYLDGRLKPSPVLNEEWFQIKAKIMYAGIVIARAAAGGEKPPFGLDKEKLGIADGLVDVDLTVLEVQKVSGKNGNQVYEVVFPVKLAKQNKTLWVKVGQVEPVPQPQTGLSAEQTLEESLTAILDKLRVKEDIDDEKAQQIESENSSDKPAIVPLSIDVKAAISDKPDAVKAVKVSG